MYSHLSYKEIKRDPRYNLSNFRCKYQTDRCNGECEYAKQKLDEPSEKFCNFIHNSLEFRRCLWSDFWKWQVGSSLRDEILEENLKYKVILKNYFIKYIRSIIESYIYPIGINKTKPNSNERVGVWKFGDRYQINYDKLIPINEETTINIRPFLNG